MVTETASSPGPFRNAQMSKAAQTHKLRKLRAPSKCRECDSLVVFHGAECGEVQYIRSFISCRNDKYVKLFHDASRNGICSKQPLCVAIWLLTCISR